MVTTPLPSPAATPGTAPVGVPLQPLAIACLVGAFGSVALCTVGHLVADLPMAYGMAAFLVFFGAYKLVVALNQILGRATGPAGERLRAPHFASAAIFWAWVGVKVAVWIIAWIAAVVLINHPGALVLPG